MSSNNNLVNAKIARNDLYFTRLEDIEAELSCYPNAFKNKQIYMPCDDPKHSQFWRFFIDHADELAWKSLVATSLNLKGKGAIARASRTNIYNIENDKLNDNGDFLSDECIAILDESDIVVTNLPFSRFRDYVRTMMEHERDFIVIGGKNGGKYQDTIQFVVDGKMRLGANKNHGSMRFTTPDGEIASVGAYWYTTLAPDYPPRDLVSKACYKGNETDYPHYANYDAIEVPKISLIPKDYTNLMGVPITFLEYYDPNVWELLGTNATVLKDAPQDPHIKANSHLYRRHNLYLEQPDGSYKRCYDRLIVRRKTSDA